jgi:hypothetical protein
MDRSKTEIELVIDELVARSRLASESADEEKPKSPNPEEFPPDLLYEKSQGARCLVGVLIVVAMAWVFGALCGYGFHELLNQSGVR